MDKSSSYQNENHRMDCHKRLDDLERRLRKLEEEIILIKQMADSIKTLTKEFHEHTLRDDENFNAIRETMAELTATTKLLLKFSAGFLIPILLAVSVLVIKIILGIPL